MKNNYAICCLSIFLLVIPLTSECHNILKGKVICENSSSPLAGANVVVKGSSEGTITDEWGNFTLDTDYESGILEISFIGYITSQIEFSSHTEFLVIPLKPDMVRLSDVFVSGSKSRPGVSMSQIDVNVRTVNSSQDVLRIVPGLFIAQHAGGGKSEQIFLRGFDCDHGTDVNISVDGMPVNMVSQAHGQGYADLHWVIPELVRQVDFGKGPYYTEHGDFATAGYAEFKTIGQLEKNMIKLEAGNFNTFRTVGLFNLLGEEAKLKGKSAYAALEYLMTDGPFEHAQNFHRINFFTKFNIIMDQRNMFTFTASLFDSKWDQSGQIPQSAVDDGMINRWGSLDPTEGGRTGRYNLSINSLHKLNDGSSFKNLVYYTRYNFDLYSNFTFYLNDPVNGDQIRQKEERNLYGYTGTYVKSFSFAKENTLETKIIGGFRIDDINNSQLLNTRERFTVLDTSNFGDIYQNNLHISGKINWMKKKWLFSLGLRFDGFKFEYVDKNIKEYQTNSKYKRLLSPKLNIAYNASKDLQFYVIAGQGFHTNDARLVTRYDSLPTVPLAYGSDLGVNWKPSPHLIVNAALWYMYMESELVWSGDAGSWEPSGKTNRYGIDLSLRWQIINWLFFDTDINYGIARFIDEPKGANYIPLAPTWTSTGGLTLSHPSGWSGALRYRYMSDRPADETNEVTALGYFIMDLNTHYSFHSWTIGMTVVNLLNSNWNEAQFAGDYRVSESAPAEYGLTYTPGTPIFIKGSVSFEF